MKGLLASIAFLAIGIFVGACIRDWRDKAREAKRHRGSLKW